MFWLVLFIGLTAAEIYNGTAVIESRAHMSFALGRPEEFAYNIVSCHNHSINIFVLVDTEYHKFMNNSSFGYIEEYSKIDTSSGRNNIMERSEVDLYIVITHNCEETVVVDYHIVTTTLTVTNITLLIIIFVIVIIITFTICTSMFNLKYWRCKKSIEAQPLLIMNGRYDTL